MQTATKMMTVTSKQINAASNVIKTCHPVLARFWARQAIDVACNHNGITEIEDHGVLAVEIKSL